MRVEGVVVGVIWSSKIKEMRVAGAGVICLLCGVNISCYLALLEAGGRRSGGSAGTEIAAARFQSLSERWANTTTHAAS
jgi:hypothetical protein